MNTVDNLGDDLLPDEMLDVCILKVKAAWPRSGSVRWQRLAERARVAAMNVPALREEHRKLFGEEPASAHRQFLFRKIAWRLQADEEGGLSEAARDLLPQSQDLQGGALATGASRPAPGVE